MVVLEEEFQNISPEELRSELPERQPRFVVYSYKYSHADGRVSYPLCFIFSSPVGCKPEQQMMYAGSKNRLVQTAELTKVLADSPRGSNLWPAGGGRFYWNQAGPRRKRHLFLRNHGRGLWGFLGWNGKRVACVLLRNFGECSNP
ncbi:glia maturation factor gamma isoform X3 [Peromyscus californicus insignis]|nr:glia maturation factor gamma isoform X3 [Peromyscus californicus insignis]XP_052569219.1 glia maturation factor gamma isoform X3 [Peromyscus californicus insignis]